MDDQRRTVPGTTVGPTRIDEGVYTARGGRWRIVSYAGRWLVTDGWGRYHRGRSLDAASVADACYLIRLAEATPEGDPRLYTYPPRRAG